MSGNMEVKGLFKYKRFPESEFKILCLVLYLPLGIVLFILRTILALSVVLIGCSLTDTQIIHKIVNKVACLMLGITVTVENPDKRENVEVYVSNNLSIFDQLAIHAATGSVSPGAQMHPSLSRGLGIHYFGSPANLETFKKNVTDFINERHIPVHFLPEDKVTNGKAVLKFKTYPFSITNKIQPVCMNVERPFLDLSVTTLGASYWTDVMFYMFSPFTNYKLKFLPPLERKSLGEVEFSEIVRQNIASSLKVETPELSAADLLEYEKRHLAERQRPAPPPPPRPTTDPELRRMANQVKEVLPHVPLSAIFKDLSKTRNVDATITNVLEGRVHFVPEQVGSAPVNPQPSTSVAGTSVAPSTSKSHRDLFNTAASTFAKSAQERNRSFQERKEQLIANARRRYIEKHNLNLPA